MLYHDFETRSTFLITQNHNYAYRTKIFLVHIFLFFNMSQILKSNEFQKVCRSRGSTNIDEVILDGC